MAPDILGAPPVASKSSRTGRCLSAVCKAAAILVLSDLWLRYDCGSGHNSRACRATNAALRQLHRRELVLVPLEP